MRHRKSRSRKSKTSLIATPVRVAKNASRKYMPKLKNGLEKVGDKVLTSGKKTVPFLQRMTRKLFGMFSRKRR